MSTKDILNQANQEYGGGSSGFFKFEKSGVFKLRLLTKPVALATHFFGKGQPSHICYGAEKGCPFHGEGAPKDDKGNEKKPNVKFVMYVIDYLDNAKVKLAEIPYSVLGAVGDLEVDEDFKFDSYPMPYDIKVTFDKDNKDPKSIYKTLGSPTRTDIPDDVMKTLMDKLASQSPEQFVQKRKDTELEKQKADGTWQKAQDERVASLKVAQENAKKEVDPAVDYPEEEINPEDIPF